MNIGVLGTEMVAKTVAGKLASLGHSIMLGTRDVRATLSRSEGDKAGGPAVRTWLEAHPNVKLGTLAEAAAFGEMVFNALSGQGSLAAVPTLADALLGKILVDITNPLDFSRGMPPSLFIANTDSLGERLQKALPGTRVVKTLNTVNAFLMMNPTALAGADHSMFVAGDDEGAKAEVTRILKEWLGWKDVIDLGDITMARGTEMWLPMWVRLWGALKTPTFNLKIVR
jgi:predicted dinucleotide-binding enzyme